MTLSGWAWWIDLVLALLECGMVAGVALWLGPGVLADVRTFLEEERQS